MATGYLDNFYARLGIPTTATQEEVRNAFHAAARKFHPDVNQDSKAPEIFLQIQEAYETLSNPAKRVEYDKLLPRDVRSPENILVNTIYSRESLTVMENSQLLYVLLNIMAAPDVANKIPSRQPLNICIVIDTSNSMSGERLDTVKDTALHVIKSLKPQDILSVVTFSDYAQVIVPGTRNQSLNVLEARISQINASGGTEIFKGLEAGYNEILQNLRPNYQNHLILITDGRTYGDEPDCLELARTAAANQVTIHALGIGDEWNDEFMEALTSRTGGTSEFADSPYGIKQFLSIKFGQLQNTFAYNLALEYSTPDNVNLRYAYRISPDSNSIPIGDTLILGDIPKHQSLSVVLEFEVASASLQREEFIMLDGTLEMVMPTAIVPNISTRLTFSRPLEENPVPVPPPRILVEALSRLSMYRLQEMARRDIKEGNIGKATSRLKNLATQLLSSGEKQLAETVMLELDQIRATSHIGPEAAKRIKYGTRALLLGTIDEGPQS